MWRTFQWENQGNRLTMRERQRLVKPSSTVDVEFAYTGALGGAPVYCTALRDSLTANNSVPSISRIRVSEVFQHVFVDSYVSCFLDF